ncbi:uncharacterized protein LOC117176423 [Belonocnema kinseyi]|uniref:uncharacterized protein LOC117176423 n=1 Tax=Belonocnema kinseyi TaxID=2817044 RepID=UPI00143D345B|nr:uncharacterized protein LOC117176423 [Belonocnema kinseyi]
MYFSKKILILFFIAHYSWCEDTKKKESPKIVSVNETKSVDKNSSIATTVPPVKAPLPNVCEKCNCTENSIKCETWDSSKVIKDYKWPNNTWEVVSFENTPLIHLTPFPALSIKKLVFTGNNIQEIDNKIFINITDLVEVDLSNNNLSSRILHSNVFEGKWASESYEPLKTLKVLNLSYNHIHTLNQRIFEHTKEIRLLSLRGNPFTMFDTPTRNALSDLPLLEELDISYCGLKSLPHEILHTSHMILLKLDLSGNKFTTPPLAFEYAKSLKVLTMDNNPIEFIGPANAFPELALLEELNLRNMSQLNRIGEGAFSKLKNLSILRIQNCLNFTEIHKKALVQTIGTLIPGLGRKFMGEKIDELKCAAPPEHIGKNLSSLAHRKLRCLDLYEARPERDAAVLVGILIGLLLMVPIGLTFFFLWKRGFFFCGSQSPGSFSRAFYRRTPADEI